MDPIAMATLAEDAVIKAIQLYKFIQANNANVRPLADVVASADAGYDAVIAKGKAEIAAVITASPSVE